MAIKNVDITKSVKAEIIERSLDLTVDYSELGIDTFLQESVLKEIPFIKSIVSFYNITNSVIDRHKVKKILSFFYEFHRKEIDQSKLLAFKEKFNVDSNYRDKVVDTILLLNERFLQVEKSKILANLLKAHIEESITWQELQDISFVLDTIHPKAFEFLEEMSTYKRWAKNTGIEYDNESLLYACGIGHRYGTKFSVRPLGQQLYIYGIKPVKE